jgi:aspartate racemase
MHIGVIGGIGPAATDFYYRRLISTFARNKAALELTTVHADTPTLLKNLASNDAVNRALAQRAFKRIGILGTRTVMETRFYGGLPRLRSSRPAARTCKMCTRSMLRWQRPA